MEAVAQLQDVMPEKNVSVPGVMTVPVKATYRVLFAHNVSTKNVLGGIQMVKNHQIVFVNARNVLIKSV